MSQTISSQSEKDIEINSNLKAYSLIVKNTTSSLNLLNKELER
jgi:hypothetical protein